MEIPTEIPTPNETWLKLLSDQGLGVLFAMVCIFFVLPCAVAAMVFVLRWSAKRIDNLISWHKTTVDAFVTNSGIIAGHQADINHNQREIRTDFDSFRLKLNDIHEIVALRGCLTPIEGHTIVPTRRRAPAKVEQPKPEESK